MPRVRLAAGFAALSLVCASVRAATPQAAPAPATAPEAVSEPEAMTGEMLYRRHCLSCHQADGGGVPNMQPPIAGGTWVTGDPRALALFVLTGGFDSAARKDSVVSNVMPPFSQLGDDELAAILTYIRGKFGKDASPVSADVIAAARKEADPR